MMMAAPMGVPVQAPPIAAITVGEEVNEENLHQVGVPVQGEATDSSGKNLAVRFKDNPKEFFSVYPDDPAKLKAMGLTGSKAGLPVHVPTDAELKQW